MSEMRQRNRLAREFSPKSGSVNRGTRYLTYLGGIVSGIVLTLCLLILSLVVWTRWPEKHAPPPPRAQVDRSVVLGPPAVEESVKRDGPPYPEELPYPKEIALPSTPLLRLMSEDSDIVSHLGCLCMLAQQLGREGRLVELGVRAGRSTMALLAGAEASGGRLVSVDIDPDCKATTTDNMVRLGFGGRLLDRWEFRVSDSVKAAELFPNASVSLLFIDTSHELEHTRRELKAWLPKMLPKGIICGHDYLLRWAGAGVKQAVDEFAAMHKDRFELLIMPNSNGLFCLVPRGSKVGH